MDVLLLGFIGFLTSMVAGVVGLGGGLLLIAVLPPFLPTNALIPIHGLSQLSSNLSRAYFGYKNIRYEVVPEFLIGSLAGVGAFALILSAISTKYIPLFIGIYIILSIHSQRFNDKMRRYENYYIIGFFQSGLSVVVGTTGPLAMTKLLNDFGEKDIVVATSAILMSITHLLKIVVFIYFGFAFFDYLGTITAMVTGTALGSYAGTKIRDKIDGEKLIFALKILLTIMAAKSIITVF